MKDLSSRRLQQEYIEIRKQYWGKHLWSRGYFSATTGTVTDEMISDYIDSQTEEDDNFRVGY